MCLYPRFVPLARRCLAGSGVRLATVANFPQGGEDIVATAEETAAAVAAGIVFVVVVWLTGWPFAAAFVAACAAAAVGMLGGSWARTYRLTQVWRGLAEHPRELVEDQSVDVVAAKRIGRRRVVMAVADHQRAVGALGDD